MSSLPALMIRSGLRSIARVMLGMSWWASLAVTVLRLTSSCSAHARTAPVSVRVSRSSPELSSTTRMPFGGCTPSHDPGRGVIVASGAGRLSMNPGPSVPIAFGLACGSDQSSAPQAASRTAVRSRAQTRVTQRECRLRTAGGSGVHTSFTAGVPGPDRMRRPMAYRLVLATVLLLALTASPAHAHGFSSVVYVDATSPARGHVRTVLGLEYDLLVVSAADAERDDPLFKQATPAWEARDAAAEQQALDAHAATVMAYVTKRFGVSAGNEACTAA